jgi:hypothetical protein
LNSGEEKAYSAKLLKCGFIFHYFRVMIPDIPIVVIGYNRPTALRRLMESLSKANYPGKVKLYISLDGGGGEEVRKVAREFEWRVGEKELIFHDKNLGLRQHVLTCGDISSRHEGIIVLEDDLLVSPEFYDFATMAYGFYSEDPEIAGISLYHHAYNETAQFPFVPLNDGSDVYFLKYAASWGQLWGKKHWRQFRDWYDHSETDAHPDESIPANIKLWPSNSWKKFFIEFLIQKDYYFVYPRVSFTTIFGDEGTNIRMRETFLQVPLYYGKRPFRFVAFEDSYAVYDTWCEILPDRLKRLVPALSDEEFDVDLYGMKFSEDISSQKILSGRICRDFEMTFGREMKPHEENIIHQLPGNYFHLGKKEQFKDVFYLYRLLKCHEKAELSYWFPLRPYHFGKRRIITANRRRNKLAAPVFVLKKAISTLSYAIKYFFPKREPGKDG